MTIRPLSLVEWLEQVRAAGTDPAADFATEALDIIENNRTDDFHEVRDDLEKAAGKSFKDAWRMVDFFTDRHYLLAEIEDRLDKAGYQGDPDDALGNLLSELWELRSAANEVLPDCDLL